MLRKQNCNSPLNTAGLCEYAPIHSREGKISTERHGISIKAILKGLRAPLLDFMLQMGSGQTVLLQNFLVLLSN